MYRNILPVYTAGNRWTHLKGVLYQDPTPTNKTNLEIVLALTNDQAQHYFNSNPGINIYQIKICTHFAPLNNKNKHSNKGNV